MLAAGTLPSECSFVSRACVYAPHMCFICRFPSHLWSFSVFSFISFLFVFYALGGALSDLAPHRERTSDAGRVDHVEILNARIGFEASQRKMGALRWVQYVWYGHNL